MINTEYINIITTALADETGIKIIPSKKWSSNIKNRTLEYNPADLNGLDPEVAKGLLIHEVGHLKFTTTDGQPTQMEKDHPENAHRIINAIEDIRIKTQLSDKYTGFGDFARYPLEYVDDYYTRLNLTTNKNEFEKMSKVDQMAFLCLFSNTADYNTGINNLVGATGLYNLTGEYNTAPIAKFSPEVLDIWTKNRDKIRYIVDKSADAITTDQMTELLSRELYPIIKPLFDDDKKNNKNQKPQPDKNGINGGGDIIDAINKAQKSGATPSKMGVKKKDVTTPTELDAKLLYSAKSRVLGKHIADILQERKAKKWVGNHTNGKLLSKNVYKIVTNDINIFSKKLDNLPDRYIFYLAVDSSGSMSSNSRAYNAVMSAYILKFAISKTGLPLKISSFDDHNWNLLKISDYCVKGGTNDLETLTTILADGKKHPDDEKIVIFLTDGETMIDDRRVNVINEYKKDATFHLATLGISLLDHQMIRLRQNYPASYCQNVPNPDDLPNAILRTLNSLIKR